MLVQAIKDNEFISLIGIIDCNDINFECWKKANKRLLKGYDPVNVLGSHLAEVNINKYEVIFNKPRAMWTDKEVEESRHNYGIEFDKLIKLLT